MADKLKLINDALQACGSAKIDALNDGSTTWDIISAAFDSACRNIFAQSFIPYVRALSDDLVSSASTDENFEYQFTVPADFNLLLSIQDDAGFPVSRWQQRGGIIYTDVDSIRLDYISADVATIQGAPEALPLYVQDYLVAQTAYNAVLELTGSESREQTKKQDLKELRSRARQLGSKNSGPRELLSDRRSSVIQAMAHGQPSELYRFPQGDISGPYPTTG